MRVSGVGGTLRVGYQEAATLARWEIVPLGTGAYVFHGRVASAHPFWATQGPLDLVLTVGQTEMAWRGAVPSAAEGEDVTATLAQRPTVTEHARL